VRSTQVRDRTLAAALEQLHHEDGTLAAALEQLHHGDMVCLPVDPFGTLHDLPWDGQVVLVRLQQSVSLVSIRVLRTDTVAGSSPSNSSRLSLAAAPPKRRAPP